MEIPSFSSHQNGEFHNAPPGKAFEAFVFDLLSSDYPGLHSVSSSGKYVGIDLIQTTKHSQVIIECKDLRSSRYSEIHRAWLGIADTFKNLINTADNPTYGLWHQSNHPVTDYILCLSSVLHNQDQIDRLQQEITRFFIDLSSKNSYLQHLSRIAVKVLDWNDLYKRLTQRPHVLFRWFPSTLPQGLKPLDQFSVTESLQSYLFNERLPYYSLNQHLKETPLTSARIIPDEAGLLGWLKDENTTGIIITGNGGIGKTRLTLELGQQAEEQGQLVLQVASRLRDDALERLAASITSATTLILLFDSIETLKDFSHLVETLDYINDSNKLNIRYIANCRDQYYSTIAGIIRHRQISLSPNRRAPKQRDWFKNYREQVVQHILQNNRIQITENIRRKCRDIPGRAVFIANLFHTNQQVELNKLIEGEDFNAGVLKQISYDSGESTGNFIHRLALLISLFPISTSALSYPELEEYRTLLDRLTAHGWIEGPTSDTSDETLTWFTTHDVVTDQVLLSYLSTPSFTGKHFVNELFSLARKVGALRSALLTLQRNISHPRLRSLDWLWLLSKDADEDPLAWREVRDILIRTSLLSPLEKLTLINSHEEVWVRAETETDFQNGLGWLAKWTKRESKSIDSELSKSLVSWIEKAAPYVSTNNYLLTWGLRLSPKVLYKPSLEWILTRPSLFQTHYVLVAWLEEGLPLEEVRSTVQTWLSRFQHDTHVSFVVTAWLNAGGDTEAVREALLAWLTEYGTSNEAQFVYRAWLSAGGHKEFLLNFMPRWLHEHGQTTKANYLYRAWLDAGGDKQLVIEPLVAWLDQHGANVQASFVYRAWLDAGGDKEVVFQPLAAWLSQHGTAIEAQYIYRAWLDAGGDKQLVIEPLVAWLDQHGANVQASFVYRAWLDAGGDKEVVWRQILHWITQNGENIEARFVYSAWLNAGGDIELIRFPLATWINGHETFHGAAAVYRAWLNAGGERDVVHNGVAAWLMEQKHTALARGVYLAWLDAGGSEDIVDEPFIHSLQPIPPKPLTDSLSTGDCVLYVGSDVSSQVGFPTWQRFIEELLTWSRANNLIGAELSESYRIAFRKGEISRVAEGLGSMLQTQGNLLSDYLSKVFSPARELSESHRVLSDLPFSASLTTNFDDLLERTFQGRGGKSYTAESAETLLEALHRREFFILKLYGEMLRPHTISLAPTQFEDVVRQNLPFSQLLETLFFSRTVLFIGASLDSIEENMQSIGLRRQVNRTHYALIAAEGDEWRSKAELLSRRYNITVLPYVPSSDHPQVSKFLAYLRQQVKTEIENITTIAPVTRLRRVYLENIGPFDHLDLKLHDEWNIVLGDNGVGKSSILKAIGIAICGKDAQPYAGRLIKSGKTNATIVLETERNTYKTELFTTISGQPELNVVPLRPLEAEDWLALGFPPLRTVTWDRPKGPEPIAKGLPTPEDLLPLIKGIPDPRLDSLKQWIVNIDYRIKDQQAKTGSGGVYEKLLGEFFQLVGQLSEGLTIRRGDVAPETNEITIITDDGEIPLESLSQGIISLIGWAGILLQRLYEIYGDEEDPRQRYALVLIDEIDAHLHPAWQQTLVHNLSKIFPNVQFIVTTHSPLIVGGMNPNQIFRFTRDEDGSVVQIEVDPEMTVGRADQILTGDLFNLRTTLDTITQDLLERYKLLLGKIKRNPEEEEEFKRTREELQFRIPMSAESPAARRAQAHARDELFHQLKEEVSKDTDNGSE